jgi:hypothetical protein
MYVCVCLCLCVCECQVDMRAHNSWTMRLHEVSTPELAEVLCKARADVFVLNSQGCPIRTNVNEK